MKKFLLLSIMLCAFAFTAGAQQLMRQTKMFAPNKANVAGVIESFEGNTANLQDKVLTKGFPKHGQRTETGMWVDLTKLNPAKKQAVPTRAGEGFEADIWWGLGEYGGVNAMGFNLSTYPTTYDVATAITSSSYVGAVVDSIAFFIVNKDVVSNVSAFIGNNFYDQTPFDGSRQQVTELHDFDDAMPYNFVKLDKPYTITSQGCVIGYSFTLGKLVSQDDLYCLPFWTDASGQPEESVQYGFCIKNNELTNGGWMDLYQYNWGNLAIMVHINIPEVQISASPLIVLESTVIAGNTAQAICYIRNTCFKKITDVNFIATIDGVKQDEMNVTFDTPVAANELFSIYVEVPTTKDEAGIVKTVEVEITKVNGEANNATSKVAAGNLIVLENAAPRISVAEEFTGTWCGYCPRGHVALENLRRDLGGSVIPLAVHFGDPMYCDSYDDVITDWSGGSAPIMAVDRVVSADPYYGIKDGSYGATELMHLCAGAFPSEATIKLTASWADAEKTAINVSTTTNFLYDRYGAENDTYAIGFVLTENGMSGTDDNWKQANYFSGATLAGYPADIQALGKLANPYSTTYDNVVVAAWNPYLGTTGSVKEILNGVPSDYSTTLSIAENTLIQNKDNLYLTAILFNCYNSSIVNAYQINLKTGASGITGVTTENGALEVARYNINGVKLDAPQKGLNIIKLSNGQTVKMMVK